MNQVLYVTVMVLGRENGKIADRMVTFTRKHGNTGAGSIPLSTSELEYVDHLHVVSCCWLQH